MRERGVIRGLAIAIIALGVGGVVVSQAQSGTPAPGRAGLEVIYTNPEGFAGLTYLLTCDPASGTISNPAAVCTEISKDPGMVFSSVGRDHSCRPSPSVGVRGTDAGHNVRVTFSPCLSGQDEAALGHWLAYLPSAEQENRLRLDRALGILYLGEREAAVSSLLGPPQAVISGLDVYQPYDAEVGDGCHMTTRGIVGVGYDRAGRVVTLIGDQRELTIDGKKVSWLAAPCPGEGEPRAHGPLKKWVSITCGGSRALADHDLRRSATVILLTAQQPTVIVSRTPTTACLAAARILVPVVAPLSPPTIDSGEHFLNSVACPSTTECTAVDGRGHEVTFNPTAPEIPSPITIDDEHSVNSIACPSSTQCTAVDGPGQAVTFNPTAPGTPTPLEIDNGSDGVRYGVACPSISQCTAVGYDGQVETFNPASPDGIISAMIDGYSLEGIACPSNTQCTAVGEAGREVTFNPGLPSTPTPITIDGDHSLSSVACPSSTQCTAVDDVGQAVTFNPSAPGTPTPITIDSLHALRGIACPSSTQCTAVGEAGREVTFNPGSGGTPTPITIGNGTNLDSVACSSTTQCTTVDGGGHEATFNPGALVAT